MSESIWEFKADGENAIHALESITKVLNPLDKIMTVIQNKGGVSGMVAGDPREADNAAQLLSQLNDELQKQEKLLHDVEDRLRTVTQVDAWRKLTKQADDYAMKIGDIQDEMVKLKSSGGGGGDDNGMGGYGFGYNRPSQAINQLLMSASMADNELGNMARSVGDFVDAGSRMQDSITDLGESAIESGGKINQKLGTGLKKVGTVVGVAGAALAGFALGVELYNGMMGRSEQKIRDNIEALQKQATVQEEIAGLRRTGTAEGVQEEMAALRDHVEAQTQYRDELVASAADTASYGDMLRTVAEKGLKDGVAGFANLFSGITHVTYSTDQLATAYGTQADEIRNVNSDIDDSNKKLEELQKHLAEIAAAEALRNAESDLTQTRLQARDATKEYTKSITQFQNSISAQRIDTARQRQHDDETALTQHNREMEKLTDDGQKTIQSIVKDNQKTIATLYRDSARAEARALLQLNRQQTSQEKDYQKTITKTWASYYKARAKDDINFAREELRRKQDLSDNLFDLELQNDAVAYISAQRQAEKDNQRAEEDRQTSLSDERTALQDQLDEMAASAQDARQQMLDSYELDKQDRQAALAEQLGDEKAAQQERLQEQRTANLAARAEANAAWELQKKDEAEQRAFEDETTRIQNARQLQTMVDAYDDQMKELSNHEADLLRVINSGGQQQLQEVSWQQLKLVDTYRTGTNQIVSAVQASLASANVGGAGWGSGSSSGSYGGSQSDLYGGSSLSYGGLLNSFQGFDLSGSNVNMGGGGGGLFADEGVVATRPTLTLLGERRPEAVLPLSPSGGISDDMLAKMMQGAGNHFDFSGMTIGSGISESVLKSQLQIMAQTVVQGLRDARLGAPSAR